jgi:hypothetical protein
MAHIKNAWSEFQRSLQCRQPANVEKMRKFHELLVQMSQNAGQENSTKKHPALLERLKASAMFKQFRPWKRA